MQLSKQKIKSRKSLWFRTIAILLAVIIAMPVMAFADTMPIHFIYDYYADEYGYEEAAIEAFGIAAAHAPLTDIVRTASTPPNVGNQNFQDILTYFPELWCPVTERTQPTFSLEHPNLIQEIVWVEIPMDSLSTGNNIQHYERGNRDLMAIRITRPRQADPLHPHTGNEANAEALVRLPVLMTASPYRNNNIRGIEWLEIQATNVADERFNPVSGSMRGRATWHSEVPMHIHDIRNNPSTANLHYDDIRWRGLTLDTWPWGDAAFTAHPLNQQPMANYYNIPASRGERPRAMANYFAGNVGNAALGGVAAGVVPGANFNNFMFTRGFAKINVGMAGLRFSNPVGCAIEGPFNTGMSTSGEVSRKIAAVAVTAWLNGEARAYTCAAATHEVVAYWANGDVIMTGTSYDGTTAYAAASAGFTRCPSRGTGLTLNGLPRDGGGGIRAIFPVAGIASMYEYHRRNGAQFTPEIGLSDEVEHLGRFTQSLYFSRNFQLGQPDRDAAEHVWLNIVRTGNDHHTGDYNTWWDHNNFFRDVSPMVNARVGILSSQGFNDLNVAITNNEPVHWAMHQLGGYHKQILHLHGHTNVWGWGEGRAIEIAHAWMDYFVYDINGSFQQNFYAGHAASGDATSLFDIETVVACIVTGRASFYSQWPPLPLDGHTYNADLRVGTRLDSMRRYYLGQNPAETGGLLLANPNSTDVLPFADSQRFREFFEPAGHRNPADPFFSASFGVRDGMSGGWHNTLMTWWVQESWPQNAWESAMLFPTSTPFFTTGTLASRGFPANGGVRVLTNVDETEILEHTPERLSFVSAPIGPGGATIAGVPRITLDIAADQHVGYISAMIVDIGPAVSRAWQTTNDASFLLTGNARLGNWTRWRYTFNAGHTNQAHVITRSSVDLENPNPPDRPIILPGATPNPAPRVHGQPGITYINTDVTIHTGMYAPFSWQTTTITPGQFNSYTFTLEPIYYTVREGHRLAVIVYATDMKHLPRTDPKTNFELQLGSGSFIYLPLLTELCIFEQADINAANQFKINHASALALPLTDVDDAGTAALNALLTTAALGRFATLSENAQALLADEKAHLDRLNAMFAENATVRANVADFLTTHADILDNDILSVGWYDNWWMGWHDQEVGDIIADNNYIHLLVDNAGVLGVVQPNIVLLEDALADLALLSPAEQALLSVEADLLADLLHHALAVEFRAEFHDVLWRAAHVGVFPGLSAYHVRPHIDGTNYAVVRPRAQAAIAAWNTLPLATRDLLGDLRNAAGASIGHAQDTHQSNPIIRLNDIVTRTARASSSIHSLVNIQGRNPALPCYTFLAGYGQSGVAHNEVRIFGAAGATPTVAVAVPYAQTAITPANINIASGAAFTMFSDAGFTTAVNSIDLTPGVATPVRVEVIGAHGTTRYTLNVTRQNNNAELLTFAGQAIDATAELNPGIYDPIRREFIAAIYEAAITVPEEVDAIRGELAMAIAGIDMTAQTARTVSPGAFARIFAAPEVRDGAPDIAAFTREIVGNRYIPLEPGVATPVYVRVRSQAFSRAAGYFGVSYYRIMVTREAPYVPAELTYTLFAEDWRESINLRFFLNGEPVEIPLENMELIVDGVEIENIRDFTLNIAGWQTAHHTVFICKLRHNWEHLTFEVTTHGQTLFFEFTNSMFVPPEPAPVLTTTIFAEDWRETINIRFFLDGVLTELPLEDIEFIVDGVSVPNIRPFTVNVAGWQTSTNAVFINKLASTPWQNMTVNITAYGQTLTYEFVNNFFVPGE